MYLPLTGFAKLLKEKEKNKVKVDSPIVDVNPYRPTRPQASQGVDNEQQQIGPVDGQKSGGGEKQDINQPEIGQSNGLSANMSAQDFITLHNAAAGGGVENQGGDEMLQMLRLIKEILALKILQDMVAGVSQTGVEH